MTARILPFPRRPEPRIPLGTRATIDTLRGPIVGVVFAATLTATRGWLYMLACGAAMHMAVESALQAIDERNDDSGGDAA